MSKSRRTQIPAKTRKIVSARDLVCPRCGTSTLNYGELHHRRSRRIHDEHTHAPGNLVRLCSTDHRWVTEHPADAMNDGWIVSSYEPDPTAVPLNTFVGWRYHHDDGSITATHDTPADTSAADQISVN